MNAPDPKVTELEQLKLRQAELELQVRDLRLQLTSLEGRLRSAAAPAPAPVTTREAAPTVEALRTGMAQAREAALPPLSPAPPVIKPTPEPAIVEKTAPAPAVSPIAATPPQASIGPQPSAATANTAPSSGSFEMRLGTYWLVRVGIVMVLTALVFFGNLAYQNFISKLGPGGKVTLLYVASFSLLGVGAWLQRKAGKPSLRNYAQVLFAGGLAAVYFTTYAAHHFQNLLVIGSVVLDGLLLLAWAGFIAWLADRKKSEILALFAVGLAFYSSTITRAGNFTLYSNLVLSAAAVFFLVRNRWAAVTIASLVASYGSYAFWRFFDGANWRWASPEEGLWTGVYFLASYWLVFSVAGFLSTHEKIKSENRAFFLTANNGAFFALFLLTMFQVRQGGLWKFFIIYGTVLLVLSELARRFLSAEPLNRNALLTQGLVLVTGGLIVKYSGLQLAAMLAVESVILLMSGMLGKNLVLKAGAYIAAAISIAAGMDGLKDFDAPGAYLGVGLGVLMLFNAFLTDRQAIRLTAPQPAPEAELRPGTTYFSFLALLIWAIVAWHNCADRWFPVVLALGSVLLTFSFYLVRIREVAVLGQGYLVLAHLAWLYYFGSSAQVPPPWWNPALLIISTLVLSHWWPRQRMIDSPQGGMVAQSLYALALLGVVALWLNPKFAPSTWITVSAILGLAFTAYGVFTRAWFIAGVGQAFHLISGWSFLAGVLSGKPEWYLTLAPIGVLSLLSYAAVRWFQLKPDATGRVSEPLLQLAKLYRWIAAFLTICWIYEYAPARERAWLFALAGAVIFAWAGARRNQEALGFSAAFWAPALFFICMPQFGTPTVYWLNLVAIVGWLAQQRAAKHLHADYQLPPQIHNAMIAIGGLCLWLFVSRWVLEKASGFYLTASWSGLALVLFIFGISFRERVYRWLGLGVLACALGRVVIFDVWKLETLFRILSFLALGIALLVLGFIYNKYQEKLREWL